MIGPDKWDQRYAEKRVWSREPNVFLADVAARLPPGRALDLATGEGRNALWLAERGWRVTGVDFSAVGIERGRRDARERGLTVEWVVADVVDYEPEHEAYDLVLVMYLHIPAEEFGHVLRKAAAAVAPGGRLLVVGHDIENVERGYGGPQDPSILYSVAGMEAAFPDLVLDRNEQVIRQVDTDHGPRQAIDTLTWAHRPTADRDPLP